MKNPGVVSLPIAVRVFSTQENQREPKPTPKYSHCPRTMFVFDTETRIDATQGLTFGSYRFIEEGQCLEEGLFYADDLPQKDKQILEKYFSKHRSEMMTKGVRWCLLSRSEFLSKLYKAVYKGRCLLVGFNLPFDLSRVAYDSTKARGSFAGGFSLGIWSYIDANG